MDNQSKNMPDDDSYDLGKFAIILIIGSLLNQMGNLGFRIISALALVGDDYATFSLTMRTFQLLIPVATFFLHSPLTREIRLQERSYDEIIRSFIQSYWLTSVIGFAMMLIFGTTVLSQIPLLIVIYLGICLIARAFTEFFLGVVRGKGDAVSSSIVSSVTGLIRGILVVILFFIYSRKPPLSFILITYGLGLFAAYIIGYLITYPVGNYMFKIFSKRTNIRTEPVKDHLRVATLLSIGGVIVSGSYWLVTYLAIEIFDDTTFKAFDLALLIVSMVSLVGSSFSIATNAKVTIVRTRERIERFKRSFFKYLGLLLLIDIVFVLFIVLTSLDQIVLKFIGFDFSSAQISMIRFTAVLPVPFIAASLLNGRSQSAGNYVNLTKSQLLYLIVVLISSIVGYLYESGIILILALFIGKTIQSIILYYTEIYNLDFND